MENSLYSDDEIVADIARKTARETIFQELVGPARDQKLPHAIDQLTLATRAYKDHLFSNERRESPEGIFENHFRHENFKPDPRAEAGDVLARLYEVAALAPLNPDSAFSAMASIVTLVHSTEQIEPFLKETVNQFFIQAISRCGEDVIPSVEKLLQNGDKKEALLGLLATQEILGSENFPDMHKNRSLAASVASVLDRGIIDQPEISILFAKTAEAFREIILPCLIGYLPILTRTDLEIGEDRNFESVLYHFHRGGSHITHRSIPEYEEILKAEVVSHHPRGEEDGTKDFERAQLIAKSRQDSYIQYRIMVELEMELLRELPLETWYSIRGMKLEERVGEKNTLFFNNTKILGCNTKSTLSPSAVGATNVAIEYRKIDDLRTELSELITFLRTDKTDIGDPLDLAELDGDLRFKTRVLSNRNIQLSLTHSSNQDIEEIEDKAPLPKNCLKWLQAKFYIR